MASSLSFANPLGRKPGTVFTADIVPTVPVLGVYIPALPYSKIFNHAVLNSGGPAGPVAKPAPHSQPWFPASTFAFPVPHAKQLLFSGDSSKPALHWQAKAVGSALLETLTALGRQEQWVEPAAVALLR
jgi:hypothetical protein